MSEQQTSIPPTKALPLNVTGSPIDHTPLGDRVPFTLKSRKMAAFVATMSPEEQEAFEVETAAQQEALRLREKRKARQMMNKRRSLLF
ncbi:hypothetical protein P691DRAFT_538809 [Macrolepiota fuliginosa MF-IS2]|uniref:Uncharacterized protein n=1 Tax=Macrolepiota fuliginosa MF-IS2 TaxID=1400762 RepID=A0A9P6BXL2_9AGAR|nr:hypothetical protein P691DRAFT_538809 [Macrolepiota fuliginosa MF-IS2]